MRGHADWSKKGRVGARVDPQTNYIVVYAARSAAIVTSARENGERSACFLFFLFPLFPKCFELETDERAEQVCKTDVTTEMEIFVTPREQMSFHDHNKIYIAGIIILYVSSHGNIRAIVQSKMFRIFFLVRENEIVFTRKIKIR